MRRRTRVATAVGAALVVVAGLSGSAAATAVSSTGQIPGGVPSGQVAIKGAAKHCAQVVKVGAGTLPGAGIAKAAPGRRPVPAKPGAAAARPGVVCAVKGPGRGMLPAPIAEPAKRLGVSTARVCTAALAEGGTVAA